MQIPSKKNPQAKPQPSKNGKAQNPMAQKASQKPNAKQMASQNSMASSKKASAAKANPMSLNQPAPAKVDTSMLDRASHVPRSYAMVISSYENVARENRLTGDAAEQLADTVQRRLNLLNRNTQRLIEDLPEYKKLHVEDLESLGSELADMMVDDEVSLKAFALLKNPTFANLMEPQESVHRTFSDLMKDHGDEKLLFGALDMIQNIQDSANKGRNPLNIKV